MRSHQRSAVSQQRGWWSNLLLVLVIGAALVFGPRSMDGMAALAWVRHFVEQGPAPRGAGEQAQKAGRFAARAIDRTAPLPMARTAARLALDLGRNIEPADPAAALVLYTRVREALGRARGSRVRGFGLEGLASEAATLEQQARVRALQGSATPPDSSKTP